MAEEFNSMDDILKQWADSGPREPAGQPPSINHVDVTVYLTNGANVEFRDAEFMDTGGRVIVMHEAGSTIFNERAVSFYDIEPMKSDEES